jgi:hypothetical protein
MEEIVLYVYNEASKEKAKVIEDALEVDGELREEVEMILYLKRRLGNIQLVSPGKMVVNEILRYLNHPLKADF